MKRYKLLLGALLWSAIGFAQSPTGLIAHWDMNGTTNDVSGHGHTGHGQNITTDVGIDGIMGHGYYFNGTNSKITGPYLPDLNVQNYSICAIVKVMGFNSGTCQHNIILTRSKTGSGTCNYMLSMGDQNSCSVFDSTIECFSSTTENRPLSGGSYPFFYTPTITSNTWYKVVATFNDTAIKIYVNGQLKTNTALVTPGVPLGTSTDSLSLGYNIFEGGYPYPFKGIMDDVRLYGRVLNDSEVVHYGDTCGYIVAEPHDTTTHTAGTVTYTVGSSILGALYQWQENTGAGFTNLTNSGPYSGVNTATLTITGVPASLSAANYRCVIGNTWGCADTSGSALLNVAVGVNDVLSAEQVVVYPNPVSNTLNVTLPNVIQSSYILMDVSGRKLKSGSFSNSVSIDMGEMPSGIYTLRIQSEGQTIYKKMQK